MNNNAKDDDEQNDPNALREVGPSYPTANATF